MKTRAFTLIELLVVISIIGLLSSVVLASLNTAREKARIAGASRFDLTVRSSLGSEAVGYWRLDETGGNSAADSSGNGSTGSVSGALFVAGLKNNALSFDGTDDRVNISLNIAGFTKLSYSAWIKTSVVPSASYSIITGNYGRSGIYIDNAGRAQARTYPAGFVTGTSVVTDGKWHFIVATYSQAENKVKLYVDGRFEGDMSAYPDILSNSLSYMGENPLTAVDAFYNGLIDEAAIYKETLTLTEVDRLYAEFAARHRFADGGR